MVHGLETMRRMNEESSVLDEPKLIRRVCCVTEQRNGITIVLWMTVAYGLTMAESAKQCALEYAANQTTFTPGMIVEVCVKPEAPLPEQDFKIRVDAVATWINPREGCGDN